MAEKERRFKVITNENFEIEHENEADYYKKKRTTAYHTNPLRENLAEYSSNQKRRRFTIEDLLKW